jgi:glycosyltransferase involved in cell wall biosynthesis
MPLDAHQPLVSFVVLSYRFEAYLGECIESILAQAGDYSYEIIVVDDASTDNSATIARCYQRSGISVIYHEANQGHAATVNDGMAAARGAFIARIDGDDRYRPGFLNAVLPVFERYPDVGLVYGDIDLIDNTGVVTQERADRVHGGRDFKGNELVALLELNFICAPTVIARREAWQAALPAPRHLAFHDWYFTTAIARRWDFYYCDQALAEYRVHSGNLHTRITLNKTEEPSIFWLLDQIFSAPEAMPELEQAKQHARRRIYGRHYLVLADKYFGAQMDADAKRCYLHALFSYPRYILHLGLLRRLLGALVGRQRYEMTKSIVKSAIAELPILRAK